MQNHIEIVKAALHIFEVAEGKTPDVRLESFKRDLETPYWKVGFSRVVERNILGNCDKRVQYLVVIDCRHTDKEYSVVSVEKVEQCE